MDRETLQRLRWYLLTSDNILSKYRRAIGMKYDMTNMSNMEMVSVSSMDDSASHFMGTALTVDQYNQFIRTYKKSTISGYCRRPRFVLYLSFSFA